MRLELLFGAVGLLTGMVLLLAFAPNALIRIVLWIAGRAFRVRALGRENVPSQGPALLVSNHVTFADGLLIGSCLARHVRFLVWKPYYQAPLLHWMFRLTRAIPMTEGRPREVLASLLRAREALGENHLVCIFPEGGLTRSGEMLPFKRGMERIVDGLDVPIVPVRLDGLWGSVFSFSGGRILWKKPHPTSRVTVTFGAPMPSTSTAQSVRNAVAQLAADGAKGAMRSARPR